MHAIRVHLGGHDVDEVMNCDELIKEEMKVEMKVKMKS